MKKIFNILIIFLLGIFISVDAKELSSSEYEGLNITHAYVTGEIIFDVSGRFTPNLKDFMQASRTIPENEPTKLYDIIVIPKYNSRVYIDIYANTTLSSFPKLNCTKIFEDHIDNNVFKTIS